MRTSFRSSRSLCCSSCLPFSVCSSLGYVLVSLFSVSPCLSVLCSCSCFLHFLHPAGSSLRCEICQVPYRLNIVRPQRFSCSRRAFCSPDALLHLILFLAPFSLIGLSGYAVYVMVRVLLTGPSYAALVWFIAAITVFCLVLIRSVSLTCTN